ncbi:MAG: hypothetical protein F6K21_32045, partial [Symploca sp. SIO2D2]|nr:hypothetical protein [Symploca sp. SIO2D2]
GYDGADAARLTLSNSTVSGNTATNNGGGIYNYGNTPNGATVDLTSSTVSGNKTTNNNGGGIFNYGNDADAATVNLSNSTVSGNTANNKGGGIYNYGNAAGGATVTLSNSTVSGNMATNYGGGIYNYGSEAGAATVTVGNSIIADNTAPTDTDVGRSDADNAPITDNGNNLIGIDSITAFNTSTLVGDAMNPRDPKLAPLGDYGGPTQTHALLPGSPALDAGDNAQLMMLANDQRGATRVINTTVDIGAFEAQGFTLSAAAGNGQSSTVNTNFATDLQVQLTEDFDNKPLPGVTITLTPQGTTANANLGDTTLITDANGIVTTTATANTTTGTYQVAATATGVTGVNFNLTNEPGAGILTILAGNNQSTTVNTAFANNLQIQVKDEFGNVLPGVTVTLTSPTTGASSSFGSISLITNDQGIATTTVTANTIAGNYQVEANATGATGNNFNLTNNPGAAAIVNILAGNNQNTTINTAFADNLQVQVTDEFGNGVSGVTVTLSPPGTGASASLGSISLTTDATGLASTTATANSILGDYQVRADIGVSEANFDLSNISAPVVVPGDSTLVIVPGDSTLVVVPGDSTPVVVPANSSPVIVPGNSTPILVTGDSSTNNIPDFTSIWQSVLEELPKSGLEESACTTAPAIVINSTQEEEEITLDEEIETAIQRNQDCSPE